MLRKGGCAWWAVFIIAVLTFLIGFLWGTAASSRTAGSPSPVAITGVPVASTVPVSDPPKAETVKTEPVASPKAEPQAPEPVKADPTPQSVKVPDPPKAEQSDPEPEPRVELEASNSPTDPCEKAWATAVVVKLPFGGLTAVLLDSDDNCSAIVSTTGFVSDGAIMKPLKVIGGGEERFRVHVYASSSEVLRNANGNQFGIVDISGSGKKISIGDNSGSILLIIATKQEFEIGDARSFVTHYLEWIRHRPLGIESDKPIKIG